MRYLLFALCLFAFVGCGEDGLESSPLPPILADAAPNQDVSLIALGDDWSVALVAGCTGDQLEVLGKSVDISFLPCADYDVAGSSLVLLNKDGVVVRWFSAALPVAGLSGCFGPEATWRRSQAGFTRIPGSAGTIQCEFEGG